MHYKIFGDIHGRTKWRKYITDFENTTYIFVGDYTDPYEDENISFKQMYGELKDIVRIKKKHPDNVVLLLGNHDYQYINTMKECKRFDLKNCKTLYKFFEKNADLFDVAYNIGEKYFITHAGLSKHFYKQWFDEDYDYEKTPLSVLTYKINTLFRNNMDVFCFDFNCCYADDHYGWSHTHSPIWIRPDGLKESNIFDEYNKTVTCENRIVQIFGHTYPYKSPVEIDIYFRASSPLIDIDVLSEYDWCLEFDYEQN